jgi:hypothetical protein
MTATYHTHRPYTTERAEAKLVEEGEAVLDMRDLRGTAHLVTESTEHRLCTESALLLRHLSADGTIFALQQLV